MELRLGFSPLNDAGLVLVAEALGFYESEGLRVTLSREANWSNIRDKLAYGLIDAAHILAPMPLAAALNLGPPMGKIIAPMALGANGNSFVISQALKDRLLSDVAALDGRSLSLSESAKRLAQEVDRRKREGKERLIFAVPFIYSPHHFTLRHWVAAAGLDPDRQVQFQVAPPSRMALMLKDKRIDGFASGAPWPETAHLSGEGEILFSDPQYWTLKPEKVLGLRALWAKENPEATLALVRALLRSAKWANDPNHKDDLIRILSRYDYVGASPEAIAMAFGDCRSGLSFDPQTTTFPWISHAKWFMGQMVRWGMSGPERDFNAIAHQLYRPDLWAQAALPLGLNIPIRDEKDEGGQRVSWEIEAKPHNIHMPPNSLFDGGTFTSR
jgi:two-component system, oxyanion-binding sensor